MVGSGNEGRIRPSFIAASRPGSSDRTSNTQRGSNSTLLHCGLVMQLPGVGCWLSTRVEFDPPSLRRVPGSLGCHHLQPTRVEFDPPSLRHGGDETRRHGGAAQRGSNSTLLHCGEARRTAARKAYRNEGRIRPSFIAARISCSRSHRVLYNEGRIRPSFIAARAARGGGLGRAAQRGSNSTLLHCGVDYGSSPYRKGRTTRVEFDPPSLRPGKSGLAYHGVLDNEGRIRPSFIAASDLGFCVCKLCAQRGSNSTLLHCGWRLLSTGGGGDAQRGSNSTLLHCGGGSSAVPPDRGRQRGANSTLLPCGPLCSRHRP